MLPIVALVGRPNTGKSSLFNQIVGQKAAITSHIAGTTRDRVYRQTSISPDQNILLVDTGGIHFKSDNDFDSEIIEQARLAITEADVILFVVDCSAELNTADHEVAQILRKHTDKVILIGNKQDRKISESYKHQLHALGFGEPVLTSAMSKHGLADLNERLCKETPKSTPEDSKRIKIGFIGKPNVGKSSLINKLLGTDQVIVSDISGTTLDSTHLPFSYDGTDYTFIDTAGIRRRGKQVGLERFGVLRTMQTIEQTDVAFLIIDGEVGLAKQDMHVSEHILKGAKGLVIVINKADLLKPEEKNRLLGYIHHKMQYVHWAPVIFTSAKTGSNVFKLLELARAIRTKQQSRIPTSELNYFIKKCTYKHQPQTHSAKKPKIQYVTQAENETPTFVFFCKHADNIHFSYRRFLENQLREAYDYAGVNFNFVFKNSNEKQIQAEINSNK